MWPSVPAFRSFGNISCPSAGICELPNCIFSHEVPKPHALRLSPARIITASEREPDAKRLKLNDGTKEPVAQVSISEASPKSVYVGSIMPKEKTAASNTDNGSTSIVPPKSALLSKAVVTLPQSATRPVSPPPTIAASKAVAKPDAPVALMPRKLAKEPVPFTKRLTLLKALHTYMKPQNDKIAKAVKPEIRALHLTPNQLNKLAVDEEEKLALDNPSVYENILKQRLVKPKYGSKRGERR
jgi:RNA exonuclease 1